MLVGYGRVTTVSSVGYGRAMKEQKVDNLFSLFSQLCSAFVQSTLWQSDEGTECIYITHFLCSVNHVGVW